jgi:hypothetical protein
MQVEYKKNAKLTLSMQKTKTMHEKPHFTHEKGHA